MIILRVRGGLGNQLFQYAAAKALALHHQTELKLDLYYYSKHPYRKFELGNFNIPLAEASRKEVHTFTGSNPIIRFLNKRENYLRCPGVFAQPHYHFYQDFFKLPRELYLSGYFQSEKYFLSIKNQILEWYTTPNNVGTKSKEIIDRMNSRMSVSVHIRRGDYTSASYNSFFGTLPIDYYKQAIEFFRNKFGEVSFFVFSDDPQWCQENLNLTDAEFVDFNRGADSYKDLILMSHCAHNIIANSSFSWWGAWLNQNPSKVVIAPKIWFAKEYYDAKEPVYPSRIYNTVDLIPDDWIRL